jgi:hypothetical protein
MEEKSLFPSYWLSWWGFLDFGLGIAFERSNDGIS